MDAQPPFMVLKSRVVVHGLTFKPGREPATVPPGEGWARIDCSCKKANECGDNGGKLLEGLALYVRSDCFPDLNSYMSICLSDEARRCIEAELGVSPGVVDAEGAIKIATERLLVIILIFRVRHHSERVYYLVYDTIAASLYMIPYIPTGLVSSYTAAPVPRYTDAGRDCELVLLARKFWPQRVNRELVCVCTLAGMWQVKVRSFPELPYAFSADEMFTFEGMVFWADLAQGLVYCDLRTDDEVVKFKFIRLPDEYLVCDDQVEPAKMRRTISCIGGSVQFVCIDRDLVELWTLDLDQCHWKHQQGFLCPWKQIQMQFLLTDAEARNLEPQYPVLMPGGALCLLLANTHQSLGQAKSDYICSFHMHSKRPLWFGLVDDYDTIEPVILPSNFFTKYRSPRQRALPAPKRKLPSKSRYPNHSCRVSVCYTAPP